MCNLALLARAYPSYHGAARAGGADGSAQAWSGQAHSASTQYQSCTAPHALTVHTHAHTHCLSRSSYCAILCAAAFAAAVFYSKNRFDETTVLISIHVMHVVSSINTSLNSCFGYNHSETGTLWESRPKISTVILYNVWSNMCYLLPSWNNTRWTHAKQWRPWAHFYRYCQTMPNAAEV